MSYDLAQLVLAKGLGEVSIVQAERATLALNAVFSASIKPQGPWQYGVVYLMGLAIPVPRKAAQPIARSGSLTTAATAYATVASWTVTANRTGHLREVSLDSDNFAKTNWRLTIAGVQQFTDQVFRSALSLPFGENQIPAGAVVTLAAASTDGTSVVTYGSIAGSEWPRYVFSLRLRKQGGVTDHTAYASEALVRQGLPMWAYISRTDPLYLDVTNTNGIGDEFFLAQFHVISTDETRLNEIIRVTRQLGLPEAVQMVTPVPDPARMAFARR